MISPPSVCPRFLCLEAEEAKKAEAATIEWVLIGPRESFQSYNLLIIIIMFFCKNYSKFSKNQICLNIIAVLSICLHFLGKLLFLASEGGLLVSLALLLVSLACVRHMCEPPLVRTSH